MEIKYSYGGVEIAYDEKTNKWVFEMRGRERSADSLAKAKEAVDRPVKNKEATTFKRIKAYYKRGFNDGDFPLVEVTSLAEKKWGPLQARVVGDEGVRTVAVNRLFPVNAFNDGVMERVRSQVAAVEREEAKLKTLIAELKPMEIPDEEDAP